MSSDGKDRKIGIITYHRAINYGGLLQAYALQRVITELGVKCEVLDYRNERLEDKHQKKSIFKCRGIKDLLRFVLLSKNNNNKHDKFRAFSEKNIEVSSPLYKAHDLINVESKYDIIITGSDQVWNYKINGMDASYFLDFVKDSSKKKTYAASFGLSKIPDDYEQIYKKLLGDFDSILIREKQGSDIIRDLISKESSVVLDPTMLLSKDKWLNLINNSDSNDKFILVYAFGGSKNIKDLALNISRRTGYRILWISNTYKYNDKIKFIKSAGPEEFLSLFNKAEYIVTNSFHGTAFSINFNKQFFTELLPESTGVNSRLEDILELFELQDRKITSSNAKVIESRVNYEKVNIKLEEERKKSISLLKDVISVNNEIVNKNKLGFE